MARPDLYEFWEVQKATKNLTMQASILSQRHIKNGALRSKFTREIDVFGQCLVEDFENGRKTKNQVFNEVQKENRNLLDQGKLIAQKGIGLIAGVMQTVAGGATCYYSAGMLCAVYGAPLALHGANNIYENGKYFVDGDENATGLVRQGYQNAAQFIGFDQHVGNMAYYGVDLGLSVRGVFGRSTTVKPPSASNELHYAPNLLPLKPVQTWNRRQHAKRFKLFRYSSEDYLRGYQATSKAALGAEALGDAATLEQLYKESNN
ncbi:DUF4225 domain-containing protein [Vibrio anguillarum]|uniref:DUF4225 domain-containing protein n=1 Tax=Vibrio anguillarum TaxID=55601 RepID=UPI00188C851F|nr:DUF4225 domain-containing protein [Vibrio anguillarum]MBF4295643.1 DUF4225 domain-containing protein [Vibrio anguillarum]